MRIKKKVITPVEIEAISVEDALDYARGQWNKLPTWLVGAYEEGRVIFGPDSVTITTPEWNYKGVAGHMIVCDEDGNITTCVEEKFNELYDLV